MKNNKRCSIYFDTNALERRHTGKELFLDAIEASDLFYNVRDVIIQLGLTDSVQLCIPEIVWREVKQHMVDKFNAAVDSFNGKIAEIKKSFGDLIDVRYAFNGLNSVADYPAYVENIAAEFLHNPKNFVKLALLPRNGDMFNAIIENAVRGIPPFNKAKSSRKEYNDAGLKDALIWETVKQCDEKELIIFVTNDFDYNKVETTNIHICSSVAEVKSLLLEEMPITQDIAIVNRLLANDTYLLDRIISECEFGTVQSIQVENILRSDIETDEMERKTLRIVCVINVDNTKYQFTLQYDINANELIDVAYKEYSE